MDAILIYAAAILAGLLVKIVDYAEDEIKSRASLKYILALLYGLLIGYLVSFSGFASIWLGALLAQLITGKIDKMSHVLGFSIALVFSAVFGAGGFIIPDFLIFLAFASLDELDLFKRIPKDLRIWLKLAAFIYAILGRWDYFLGIIVFDAAYYAMHQVLIRSKLKL